MSKPSDFDFPKTSNYDFPKGEVLFNQAKETIQNPPPEIEAALEKGKSFYQANKPIIIAGVTVLVAMKINKRMVRKATAKALAKSLKNIPNAPIQSDLPDLPEIFEWLKQTPGMAYVAHGSKMLHMLGKNDTVLTVFGNFDKMSNKEIDKYIVKALK